MNNKEYKLTIIILLTILLTLGGYIIYDQFFANEETVLKQNTSDNKEDFTEENTANNMNKESKDNNIKENESTELEDTKDAYQIFLDNLNAKKTQKEITLKSFNDNSEKDLILKEDNYLYMKDDKGGFAKVINNKIADLLFIEKLSQSGSNYLFMINNLGDIYYIASSFDWTDNFANIKPIRIQELNKIVSIDSYHSCVTAGCFYKSDFVDIEGNRYDVATILEKYNLVGEAW